MHEHETALPVDKYRVTDPVCGMQVDADAPLQSDFRGADYRFCSQHCWDAFEADPERYAHRSTQPEADAEGACCAFPAPSASAVSASHGTTYTCPMHPEVRQQAPGACLKCGMALKPVDATVSRPRVEYTCPMHPEIVQDHPGSCPKCGMVLEPRAVAVDEPSADLVDMSRRFWISAGRFQGRCRKNQVACGVLTASCFGVRPGFRQTMASGSHGRVAPDQRAGGRVLAAA